MKSFRIGVLFGIPIIIHPSWFLLVGFTTWLLGHEIYPDLLQHQQRTAYAVMALASVALFFTSIVLHELAHSLVAKAAGIPVRNITFFVFGGVSQISREASRPIIEFVMALAGPLTSLAIGFVMFGAWYALSGETDTPAGLVLIWLAWMNAVLAVFNLIPAFPMDGGRVLRSLLWLATGSYSRSTRVAGWSGRGAGWAMMCAGLLTVVGFDLRIADGPMGGAWLIVIGIFLEHAARQALFQERLTRALGAYSAQDLMVADPPAIPLHLSVETLARTTIGLNPRFCYFVEDAGRLAGIVSAYQVRAIPEARWPWTSAAEAMVPSARLHSVAPGRSAADVLLEMESEDLTHLPVVTAGRVVGVIGRDRILGVLTQAGLLRS